MGLLALLDDESRVPRGTDVGFVDKLTKAFPHLPDFKRSKGKQFEFTIHHFAGQVSDCGMLPLEYFTGQVSDCGMLPLDYLAGQVSDVIPTASVRVSKLWVKLFAQVK